jgi:hypothetical protein
MAGEELTDDELDALLREAFREDTPPPTRAELDASFSAAWAAARTMEGPRMLAILNEQITGIAHTGRVAELPAGAYEVVDIDGAADRNVAVVRGPDGLLVTISADDPHATFAEPGSPFHHPDLPPELCEGFVVGECGHRVAGSEWRAGMRTCERC